MKAINYADILARQSKRWDHCLAKLLMRQPYWATLVWGLVHKPAPVGTACTDGKDLFWDPLFLERVMTKDEWLCFLQAHEAAHAMFLHPVRFKPEWDHRMQNIAMDYEVNGLLVQAGMELPPGAYHDTKFHGMVFEQIYPLIMKDNPKGKGKGKDKGKGGCPGGSSPGDEGGDDDTPGQQQQPGDNEKDQDKQAPGQSGEGPGTGEGQVKCPPRCEPQDEKPGRGIGEVTPAPMDETTRRLLTHEWKQKIAQAVAIAKAQGHLPAGIEKYVDDIIHPKTPWQEILRNLLTSAAKNDYDWMRPNRRYAHSGFILPSLHSQSMGRVIVLGDCSGSMWDLVSMVMGHVQNILESCKPEKLIFAPFDTQVHDWVELEPGDAIPKKAYGGGGSSCVSAFDRINQLPEPPAVVIVVTDGYLSIPDKSPEYPVIWAVTTTQPIPWGDRVQIEEK